MQFLSTICLFIPAKDKGYFGKIIQNGSILMFLIVSITYFVYSVSVNKVIAILK
jgi:hypothetical protein